MTIIEIENTKNLSVIEQLNTGLNGSIKVNYGEHILEFNNALGHGTIRHITFDWGISLLDYDVYFNDDLKIIYKITEETPVEFLFVSKGTLKYSSSYKDANYVDLERFQNVIISNKMNSKNVYIFPSKVNVQLNVIQVLSNEYKKKTNNNIESLQETLLSVFRGDSKKLPYKHLGGFNLKIASFIENLNSIEGSGAVKSLSIEGQLNLILAMQIAEHSKYVNNEVLSDVLSRSEMKKIHKAADYIVDNISQYITINTLSKMFSLSPKKLQSGFKVLYSKSVNEYIRQVRLEIARDLIKNTDLSISEIVYNVGYKSRSYFSKIFYKKYAILPTEYRDVAKRNKKFKTE